MSDSVNWEAAGYRRNVGIVLINRAGLVFVGQRADSKDDAWQMPQGGIDPGETVQQAAWRELEEETGTSAATLIAESREWLRYDLPEDIRAKVWGGNWRGQVQKWVAFRFTGVDSDIDIDTAHPEFSAWQWLPAEELVERIVPFKRDIYRLVVAEFAPLFQPM